MPCALFSAVTIGTLGRFVAIMNVRNADAVWSFAIRLSWSITIYRPTLLDRKTFTPRTGVSPILNTPTETSFFGPTDERKTSLNTIPPLQSFWTCPMSKVGPFAWQSTSARIAISALFYILFFPSCKIRGIAEATHTWISVIPWLMKPNTIANFSRSYCPTFSFYGRNSRSHFAGFEPDSYSSCRCQNGQNSTFPSW